MFQLMFETYKAINIQITKIDRLITKIDTLIDEMKELGQKMNHYHTIEMNTIRKEIDDVKRSVESIRSKELTTIAKIVKWTTIIIVIAIGGKTVVDLIT